MVLQNKHKAAASRQYKKTHSLPLSSSSSSSTSTSTSTSQTPKETGQERSLRLGSNADRYVESDEEEQGEDEEVDEELLAHQASEAEALAAFLAAQQEKLALPTTPAKEVEGQDEEDVDDSFKHLRIAEKGGGKKGKVVRGERGIELEGEAKRAQAIRDLKDRFAVSSPPPPTAPSNGGKKETKSTIGAMRKPPPLPGQQPLKEGARGGEDFLDSLL